MRTPHGGNRQGATQRYVSVLKRDLFLQVRIGFLSSQCDGGVRRWLSRYTWRTLAPRHSRHVASLVSDEGGDYFLWERHARRRPRKEFCVRHGVENASAPRAGVEEAQSVFVFGERRDVDELVSE